MLWRSGTASLPGGNSVELRTFKRSGTASLPGGNSAELRTFTSISATSSVRTREESLVELPQHLRGISLQELLDLCDDNKAWLEELQWRCGTCHRGFRNTCGPCPSCGSSDGSPQMRNLYEVVDAIIKPTCEVEGISFVEHLRGQHEKPVIAQTFVSHWWGEEFPKLVKSLERYAKTRSAKKRPRFACFLFVFVLMSLFVTRLAGQILGGDGLRRMRLLSWKYRVLHDLDGQHSYRNAFLVELVSRVPTVVGLVCFICTLTVSCLIFVAIDWKYSRHHGHTRPHLAWGFWICAFANNQFAIDHACVTGGDVLDSSFALALRSHFCSEAVAVLDKSGTIYRRIWCVFELFFIKVMLPGRFNRRISIAISNEHGVVSEGDADEDALESMRRTLSSADVQHAKASVDADSVMIRDRVRVEGSSEEALNDILKDLASRGLGAAEIRRISPLAFLFFGPASVEVIFTLVVIALRHGKGFRKSYLNTSLPIIVVFTGIFVFIMVCLLARQAQATLRSKLLLCARVASLSASIHLFELVCKFIIHRMTAASQNHSKDASHQQMLQFPSGVLAQEQTLWLLYSGILLGLCYSGVRDFHRCQRLRRFVEDFFN